MKYLPLLCLLALASCGSPLDQGYWKEHNQEADPNQNNNQEARSFNIDFESLHQNIDITFSAETFSRTSDNKVSLSVDITHPSQINISEFRIRNDACPGMSTVYTIPNGDQQTPFARNAVDLSQVSNDLNSSLENQFIYLRGSINGATTLLDIACTAIRL